MTPYFSTEIGRLFNGSALEVLRQLPDESVQCCPTSPPYWGLRDYGLPPMIWDDMKCPPHDHEWGKESHKSYSNYNEGFNERCGNAAGAKKQEHGCYQTISRGQFCSFCGAWRGQLGLEPTPELYVSHIVQVFREVRRVLRKDGTCWINLGDSYAASRSYQVNGTKQTKNSQPRFGRYITEGVKPKDLIGIPERVVLALQADGWYWRSRIPWLKKNGMPESCKDRPTTSVEYVFLLSKSGKCFYDHEAVKLPASSDTHARRYARGRSDKHKWADGGPGGQTIAQTFTHMPGVTPKSQPAGSGIKANESFHAAVGDLVDKRARRNSDWFFESFQGLFSNEDGDPLAFIVNSKGFSGAHFATFPPKLVEPMILAGTREGDTVLDPFSGACTVGLVAEKLKRKWIGAELSPTYCDLSRARIEKYLWGETEPGQERLFPRQEST